MTGDTVYEVGVDSLKAGTLVEYSVYHAERRPHVVMLDETFNQLNSDVFTYVVEPFGPPNG